MQLLIQKNPHSRVFQKRKESIIVNHELKYLDYIIYKNNEVILTNKDGVIDIEKLANSTKVDKKIKKNNNVYSIEKEKNLLKDEHVNLNSFKSNEDSKEENIISTKRKSYRQKVKDFKTNKSKPKVSSKISQKGKNLDVIKKKENQEKRQGWWNQ